MGLLYWMGGTSCLRVAGTNFAVAAGSYDQAPSVKGIAAVHDT